MPPPLSCYVWRQELLPLPHLAPEVAVCWPGPSTPHTAHQTATLSRNHNFTVSEKLYNLFTKFFPPPKIQSNKLTFSI